MLQYSPAGVLTLYDPTGSIILDTSYTQPIPYESANWICPGMFVILDGVYEEDGRFTAYTVLSPPPERREVSAEVFGHVDFLGIGVTLDMSSPAGGGGGQQGHLMRKVEIGLTHIRWAVFGEVLLDSPRTFEALRHVFAKYENNINKPTPMVWVLCGNFCSTPVSPGGEGSRQYKEGFDSLAALLSEFDRVCAHSVFIFIPGDNDPWASTFSGGSSPAWPRKSVPDVFVNRVKRAVTQKGGELRCASNPCRLGYFTSEVVVCRDNIVGRLHRSEIRFLKKSETVVEDGRDMDLDLDPPSDLPNNCNRPEVDDDVKLARKLVKTVLDQGFLSPFPLNKRPVLWDFAYTLGLYPLPSAVSPLSFS
jgi:DNA polymerase epsilon subunit 2